MLGGNIEAKPLEIPDPWATLDDDGNVAEGAVFLCVREDSRVFAPLRDYSRQFIGTAAKFKMQQAVVAALKIDANLAKGLAKSLSGEEEEAEAGEARAEAEPGAEKPRDGAEAEPEEERSLWEQLKPLRELGDVIRAAQSNGYLTPYPPEVVARCIVGWRGMQTADGEELPYSPEAAVELLADRGPAIPLDESGEPLRVRAGTWATYTVGEALRLYLPDAIERHTAAADAEAQEAKKASGGGDSSGVTSGTARTPRRRTSGGGRKRPSKGRSKKP